MSMTLRGGLLVVGLAACGPTVAVGDGSSSSSASSGSGTSEGASGTTVLDGTGTHGSTGEPGPELCLNASPPLEPSARSELLAVYDADGDGRDEVWTRAPVPGAMPPSSRITAHALGDGPTLVPILKVEREGIVTAMVDIDGDGVRDFVVGVGGAPAGWLAGLPEPEVDAVLQPLDVPDTLGSWLDADGDGWVDWLESTDEFAVLHLGDGAGGFVAAGTLDYDGKFGGVSGWPSGIPGRPLITYRATTLDLPSWHVMWGVEVSPAGEMTVLVRGGGRISSIRHVSDLDGDMIPDALVYTSDDRYERAPNLGFAHQTRPGVYGVEITSVSIGAGVVPGSFVTEGDVDVLQWTEDDEVFLWPREGGAWSTAIPLQVVGPWQGGGEHHPMQADGVGGHEVLRLEHEGNARVYQLWTIEPCQ